MSKLGMGLILVAVPVVAWVQQQTHHHVGTLPLASLKLSQQEKATLDLGHGLATVARGNTSNAVVSGNVPRAVTSGNVPRAVTRGNTPDRADAMVLMAQAPLPRPTLVLSERR